MLPSPPDPRLDLPGTTTASPRPRVRRTSSFSEHPKVALSVGLSTKCFQWARCHSGPHLRPSGRPPTPTPTHDRPPTFPRPRRPPPSQRSSRWYSTTFQPPPHFRSLLSPTEEPKGTLVGSPLPGGVFAPTFLPFSSLQAVRHTSGGTTRRTI